MAATDRRQRRRLALREIIIDSARTIVREGGLKALTMRRIAEAIDYAPASLYAHFDSREALLSELCRDGFAALRTALESAIDAIDEPCARLQALGLAYVRFALEHPDTYRLIFMEEAALTKGVFNSVEFGDAARALALLISPLLEMQAAGQLRGTVQPDTLADMLWTLLHGIASLRIACPAMPTTDDATLIATAVELLRESVARPAA